MKSTGNRHKARILIVDDEPGVASLLARLLTPFHEVTVAHSGEEALALAAETAFDLMVLDLYMPGMNGFEVLETIKARQPDLAVIMVTGFGTIDNAVRAMRRGAIDYLRKPFLKEQVVESVTEGLEQARRDRERNAMLLKAHQLLEAGLQKLDQVAGPQNGRRLDPEVAEPAPPDPDRFLQRGPLLIDIYRRQAALDETPLDLTAGEYDLLLCLAQNAPRVMNPQEIVQKTRGFECTLHEARELIRWQIYLLRQKVEADPAVPQYVVNVRGQGYMWAAV